MGNRNGQKLQTLSCFICDLSCTFRTLDLEREEPLYFYFIKETTRELELFKGLLSNWLELHLPDLVFKPTVSWNLSDPQTHDILYCSNSFWVFFKPHQVTQIKDCHNLD